MRLLVPVFLVLAIGCSNMMGPMVKGDGKSKTESRPATGFTAVDIQTVCKVDIKPGDKSAVEVTADENLLPIISAEVKDGTLVIRSTQNFSSGIGIKVVITTPALKEVKASGASTVTMDGASGDDFKLELSGASKVDWKGAAKKLTAKVSGASKATLSGTADTLHADCNGASHVKAYDLAAGTAVVVAEGASTIEVNAKEKLDAKAHGASTVRFLPTVKDYTQSLSGASKVEAKK